MIAPRPPGATHLDASITGADSFNNNRVRYGKLFHTFYVFVFFFKYMYNVIILFLTIKKIQSCNIQDDN